MHVSACELCANALCTNPLCANAYLCGISLKFKMTNLAVGPVRVFIATTSSVTTLLRGVVLSRLVGVVPHS